MKVYVVMNESLYYHSGYFDLVEVCDTYEKAQQVMQESVQNVLDEQLLGTDVIMREHYCADKLYPIEGIHLENNDGYYEYFWISERDVK